MGSRAHPMAPLHLVSTWRSRPECLGASPVGVDLARYRHHSVRSGRRADRVGLARRRLLQASRSDGAQGLGSRVNGVCGSDPKLCGPC
jgi:hypothetical protein